MDTFVLIVIYLLNMTEKDDFLNYLKVLSTLMELVEATDDFESFGVTL
jgi:hypothetical protein